MKHPHPLPWGRHPTCIPLRRLLWLQFSFLLISFIHNIWSGLFIFLNRFENNGCQFPYPTFWLDYTMFLSTIQWGLPECQILHQGNLSDRISGLCPWRMGDRGLRLHGQADHSGRRPHAAEKAASSIIFRRCGCVSYYNLNYTLCGAGLILSVIGTELEHTSACAVSAD